MNFDFQRFLHTSQQRVEATLTAILADESRLGLGTDQQALTTVLLEAMRYCVLGGGKRVRATLVYAAAHAAGNTAPDDALDCIAASIECLHAYSLIHDDLPAMDDDDLRRGMPSCHKAFGEAAAILAGDALHSLAFELLADCPELSEAQRIKLVKALASAAGAAGMVGGQHIDLSIDRTTAKLTQLEILHTMKTGALIRAAIQMGAIAADAAPAAAESLVIYAERIGLAFQVKDDLLDIEGTTEDLGKRQGSDIANNKMTYPALLGLEGSKLHLEQLREQAEAAIIPLGEQATPLHQLAEFIVLRTN